MDQDEGIVAIALLTERELALLGPAFTRLWTVEDTPEFAELLRAIDRADEQQCPPAAVIPAERL
jgi:hypothetical protein